jgi:hypothetical protein
MAGTIVANTLNTDTVGGVFTTQNAVTGIAKAWVNFNGTGTVAISGSFNVSSITDNGTGNYTVNFTTAMPNSNYSVSGSARYTTSTNSMYLAIGASSGGGTYSTSAVQVRSVSFSGGTDFDCDIVNVIINGN